MNPARAMGTFLRVWRSEWASLSRAQLANALHGVSPKARGVTARVIRRWEEGQAPAELAELDGLCQVMCARGLTAAEVNQFRQTVFQACVDRQYPDLFDGDPIAERDDVNRVAATLWQQLWARAVPQIDLPRLVTALDGLQQAVGMGGPRSRKQSRRQQEALCRLRPVLARMHGHGGRFRMAADMEDANADDLATYFGPSGLDAYGGALSVVGARQSAAHFRAHDLNCHRSAWYLLALADEAQAMGNVRVSVLALFSGLHCLAELPEPEFPLSSMQARVRESLAQSGSTGFDEDAPVAHYHLFCALVEEGRPEEAEHHLERCEGVSVNWPIGSWCRGRLEFELGHYNQAQAHFERCVEEGREADTRWIEACDRKQHPFRSADARGAGGGH